MCKGDDYIRIYIKIVLAILLSTTIVNSPDQIQEAPRFTAPVKAAVTPKLEVQIVEPPVEIAAAPEPQASSGGDIETIVRQAARDHGVEENYFVHIAVCESTLTPTSVNYNYTDPGADKVLGTADDMGHPMGLFQHVEGYWDGRAATYGYAGASIFDAVANANVTAAMFAEGKNYLWECK